MDNQNTLQLLDANQIERLVEKLYKKNNNPNEIKEIDTYLRSLVIISNIELFKNIFFSCKSMNSTIFAANSLRIILTNHSHLVEIQHYVDIFEFILNLIKNKSSELLIKRELTNTSIHLLCKITRIYYLSENQKIKNIVNYLLEISNNSTNNSQRKLVYMTFTELIYNFKTLDFNDNIK